MIGSTNSQSVRKYSNRLRRNCEPKKKKNTLCLISRRERENPPFFQLFCEPHFSPPPLPLSQIRRVLNLGFAIEAGLGPSPWSRPPVLPDGTSSVPSSPADSIRYSYSLLRYFPSMIERPLILLHLHPIRRAVSPISSDDFRKSKPQLTQKDRNPSPWIPSGILQSQFSANSTTTPSIVSILCIYVQFHVLVSYLHRSLVAELMFFFFILKIPFSELSVRQSRHG